MTRSEEFYHGTPYGGPTNKPGPTGVHVGTQEAARQALNARIGHRADGKDWDGTQEYGKTLLAGHKTLQSLGRYPTGYSAAGPGKREDDHYPVPDTSHYPGGRAAMDAKPALFPVRITGPMTNTPYSPHDDAHANGMMAGALKRGKARRGYYYTNEGEDTGSVSAVVPSWSHLEVVNSKQFNG